MISAIAQASVSTTSLALSTSQSTASMHHKLSMPRLPVNRIRTTSTASSVAERHHPPLPSPRSTGFSEHSAGRNSPHSYIKRGPSPTPSVRSQNMQSFSTEGSAAYMHPYANPALLSASDRDSLIDPFGNHVASPPSDTCRIVRNDSLATIAASEETVVLSHSTTTNMTSTSESSLANSSTSTSTFSLESAPSVESTKALTTRAESDAEKYQKRARRETKLGPISAPTKMTRSEFSVSSPYNLISLEEAQALAKERNRVASGSSSRATDVIPPFSASAIEHTLERGDGGESMLTARLRTLSAGAYTKHSNIKGVAKANVIDATRNVHAASNSPVKHTTRLPSPISNGKTLRPKRSGFLKLFNGREKDRALVISHAAQDAGDDARSATSQCLDGNAMPPPSPVSTKVSTHRVPVPALNLTSVTSSNESGRDRKDAYKGSNPGLKKPVPSLSIQVSAPPMPMGRHSATDGYPYSTLESRRSTSPKLASPQHLLPSAPPASAPPGTTQFAALSLRPVSAFFSENFADHLLRSDGSPAPTSPSTLTSESSLSSPLTGVFGRQGGLPSGLRTKIVERSYSEGGDISKDDPSSLIATLQDQLRESRKAWQRQIWELEGQVRDLKAELEEMRSGETCETCGHGIIQKQDAVAGVVHRPRAKTGTGARFASGNSFDRS